MDIVYEKTLKFSNELIVGDQVEIGEVLAEVIKVKDNLNGDLILHLLIVGATIKRRSDMILILPKKIPITTVK